MGGEKRAQSQFQTMQSRTRPSVVVDSMRATATVPGPGHYDTSSSPYTNALANKVAGPNVGAAPPAFDLFPTIATPGPGTYDPRRAPSPSTVFGLGSERTSFMDESSRRHANEPAPHDYDVRGRSPSGGLWGATTGPRAPWNAPDATPGPGAYEQCEGVGERSRSPLTAGRRMRSVDGTHKKVGAGDTSEVAAPHRSDQSVFAAEVRRARLIPGPGQYEAKPGATTAAAHGDNPEGGATQTAAPLVNFADEAAMRNDWKVGPGQYSPALPSRPGTAFSTSDRANFTDDAIRASRGKPGPGAHRPSKQANLGGQWGATTVGFDLWPVSHTPGPGQYEAKPGATTAAAHGDNPEGGATQTAAPLVNFADEAAMRNGWKVAPGLYSPPIPPLFKKEVPSVERRFGASMVIPVERGPNMNAFMHAGTGDRSGGFRKVGPRDVADEYRARLRHTRDAVLAYTMPSTLTTLAAKADESSYAKPGDGGHWRTVATGGAVLKPRAGKPRSSLSRGGQAEVSSSLSPRSQAVAHADFPPKHKPRTPRTIRRQYELRCRLGRDFDRVDAFVSKAISAECGRRGHSQTTVITAAASPATLPAASPASATKTAAAATGAPMLSPARQLKASTKAPKLANLADSRAFQTLLLRSKEALRVDHHRRRHGVDGDRHGHAESVASLGPAAAAAARDFAATLTPAQDHAQGDADEATVRSKPWWAGK